MQAIPFPDDQFHRLTAQAAAAGFEDVSSYVLALADDAAFDARCGMTDEQLRRSAAECEAALARMKQGEGRGFREAWIELGHQMGFEQAE